MLVPLSDANLNAGDVFGQISAPAYLGHMTWAGGYVGHLGGECRSGGRRGQAWVLQQGLVEARA